MKISGSLTINYKGKNHVIPADDFTEDKHLDRTGVTYSFDTGDFSAEIVAEDKNGALSWGDWETNNCSVVHNNITFHH